MMISQTSFMKAWNNKKLVAGALKAASVRRDYINYEDLLQDGIVLYAQLLDKWTDKEEQEVNKLAFRKIIWQTIDSLRKVQKYQERHTNLEEGFTLTAKELDWDNLVVLKDEIKKLNSVEFAILFEHLLANKTITKLAQESGIPRITLQRVKKRLLLKLREQL